MERYITISKKEYLELCIDSSKYQTLKNYGVNNWSCIDYCEFENEKVIEAFVERRVKLQEKMS